MKQQILKELKNHVSSQRLEKIERVSNARTRYLTVVLEDIYYTQNISSVLRSCECLGLQDVYIIGGDSLTKVNKHVAMGASNWLTIHRENRRPKREVLNQLKEQGYRLIATTPVGSAVPVEAVDLQAGKIALIMGNELEGISDLVKEMADEFVTIPMYGFSDSFNISNSAAILLNVLNRRLRSEEISWQLSESELQELQYNWIKASIKKADILEKEYTVRLAHPNDQADKLPRMETQRFAETQKLRTRGRATL